MTRIMISVLLVAGAGCTHAYAAPVVVAIQTGPDQTQDVAWIVEDQNTVIRCVNGPEEPVCRRADVE